MFHPQTTNRRGSSVRYSLLIIALLLPWQTGCHLMNRFRAESSSSPLVLEPTSSLTQIVTTINEHSRRVKQIKSDVRVSMSGVPAMLRGDLVVERPDRLRMTAGLMGMNGFDLGSNEDVFWIWKQASTPGDPPALYFARHAEYRNSAIQQQLQLQPQWLIDGLGLIEFVPTDKHTGPTQRADGRLQITSYLNNGQATTIRLTVVDPKSGLVVQQAFYDDQGRPLAYIDSGEHKYIAEHNVSLPKKIVIHVTTPNASESTLSVILGNYTINALYGDPEKLWTMPNPPDVRTIDLSRLGPDSAIEIESAPNFNSNY